MKSYLKTNDYSVSGEEFKLVHDVDLDMLITEPQPKNLDAYYQSSDYISHTDSKETFIDRIYQTVKRYSLKKKLILASKYVGKNKTLLDIGAGTGDFLSVAKNSGWVVDGVEPNPKAQSKAKEKGINLFTTLDNLPSAKTYNVITLWHVLEHLPNLDVQIKNILKHLDVEGTLIIAVPNFNSFDAAYYKHFWAAYDVPRHLWHFSQKSISAIFEKHGVEVIKTKPMLFDSFYVSLLSEKYKTGKQNFIKAFAIGLYSNLKAMSTREHSSIIYVLKRQ